MSQATLRGILLLVPKADISSLKKIFKKWGPLLEKYLESGTRADDEVELLFHLQEFCEEHRNYTILFSSMLKVLHESQHVSTPSVLKWAQEQEADDEESEDRALYEQTKPFLDELKTDDNDDFDEGMEGMYSDDDNPFMPSKYKKDTAKKEDSAEEKSNPDDDEDENFEWDDDDALLGTTPSKKEKEKEKEKDDKDGSGAGEDEDDEEISWDVDE